MSQFPNQPNRFPNQQQQNFEGPPKVNGLAVMAFVLGLLSIIIAVFLVGGTITALLLRAGMMIVGPIIALAGIASIVAIVLGAVSNSQISRNPGRMGGKGFAGAGLGTGIAGIVLTLLVLVLYPTFVRASEISNRSYCAANMTGILKSCNVYANDSSDDFPIVNAPTSGMVSFAGGTGGGRTADSTIEDIYQRNAQRGNITANLWVLVLRGYTGTKQYLCKSDPNYSIAASPTSGGYNNNFPGVENQSYAYALPWTADGQKQGFWKAVVDASLPLMADAAPHNGDAVSGGIVDVTVARSGNPRTANSPVHGGDGQLIGWSDAHASFERQPAVGYADDNIWTQNGGTPSASGRAPTYGSGASSGGFSRSISDYTNAGGTQNWDIYMMPARGTDGRSY